MDPTGPNRGDLYHEEVGHGVPILLIHPSGAIPGARVHRIEGAAHAAPFDAPDTSVHLINQTVREAARAPRIAHGSEGRRQG